MSTIAPTQTPTATPDDALDELTALRAMLDGAPRCRFGGRRHLLAIIFRRPANPADQCRNHAAWVARLPKCGHPVEVCDQHKAIASTGIIQHGCGVVNVLSEPLRWLPL